MPVITEPKREVRKSIILHELAEQNGIKDYKAIAKKYKWDDSLTSELASEVQAELENINTFNRARIAIQASPGAIDKIVEGANGDYTEPDHKLRAWEMGLRTAKALDPKLRTQELRVQHQGNVLLTIQNTFKSLGEAIESQYEVLPPVVSEPGKPQSKPDIISQPNES